MNIYRGRIDHEYINPYSLQYARDFIINVSLDSNATWRSGHATVMINGIVYRVIKGAMYEKRESVSDPHIFLGHVPGASLPDWLTGVLSGLAQFYGIDQEPEIIDAIIKIAIQTSINQFSSIPGSYVAATFSGIEITDVAIKRGSNLLAGLSPPEKEGDPKVWRLRETGEVVDPTIEDGWITFPITGGL